MSRRVAPLLFASVLTAAPAGTVPARAQTFPARAVTWVVPFTPGGVTDSGSRTVGKVWAEKLGQPVVIDNRPGGGGIVGTEHVAASKPDGYTVIYGTSGTMAANLALYGNVSYKPLVNFKPVHGMAETPLVCVANPSKPFKTFAAFIVYAKANPGQVNFGSAGPGTATHLSVELLQKVAGIKLTHIPYKGSSPALTDLIAGVTDMMCDYSVAVRSQIEAGKLVPLAVTAESRMRGHPDVPTVAELGFPAATIRAWSAVLVPAATPDAVVGRLAETFSAALKDPAAIRYMEENGSVPMFDYDPAKLRGFIETEMKIWRELVETANAKVY